MKRMIVFCAAFILALNLLAVLPASAADGSGGGSESNYPPTSQNGEVYLTPQQTLALFGSTLSGSYYAGSSGLTQNITWHYLCTSDDIGYMTDTAYLKATYSRYLAGSRASLQSNKWIFYVAERGDFGGQEFDTNYRTYVDLDTSITLTNLNLIEFGIGYTQKTPNNGASTNSSFTIYNNLDAVYTANIDRSNGGISYFTLPMYAYDGMGTVDENYLGYFGTMQAHREEETAFSVDRLSATFWGNAPVANSGSLYLAIRCPVLRQDAPLPPVPTTTTPTSTRPVEDPVSYTTGTTSELPDISVDLRRIIWNQERQIELQRWIGENAGRAVNNLAYCCDMLDKIYALMQQQGDIQSPENTELGAWMTGQLSTSTTARLPDEALEGVSFLTWMMTSFQSQLWLYTISMLSLACLTTYWFLFKGRH